MGFEKISYQVEDGAAWIKLASPPLNIVDLKMMKELIEAVEKAEKEADVVVIGSEGKHFSAGAEIKEHFPDKAPELISTFTELIDRILGCEKVTVAAVKGYALGGGFEIPLACDIILASQNAKMGVPEITLSHYPPIAIALLPRMVGWKNAYDIILTGEAVDANRAKEIGIVSRVFGDDNFDEDVRKYVKGLLDKSPAALRITKKALRASISLSFDSLSYIVNDIYLSQLIKTEDAVEGLNAFLEKRKPVWRSK
jgi:cyclohexa-1,5-dienecarbonyl-CoA hydratase